VSHLGLKEQTHAHTVDEYGQLPDLTKTNPEHDIMFTWNGTTSGVKVHTLSLLTLSVLCGCHNIAVRD
jgi:phosphoserine aminotransferase